MFDLYFCTMKYIKMYIIVNSLQSLILNLTWYLQGRQQYSSKHPSFCMPHLDNCWSCRGSMSNSFSLLHTYSPVKFQTLRCPHDQLWIRYASSGSQLAQGRHHISRSTGSNLSQYRSPIAVRLDLVLLPSFLFKSLQNK